MNNANDIIKFSDYNAFGYILNEIFKFTYLDNLYEGPSTIDNIISITGSNLDYRTKDIIKVPNCRICAV